MHRKYLPEERNGTRYVDRIAERESYSNEILRVGHTIPLSGHMGSKKTVERIAAHFSWPSLSFDVRKYCATCPQCQVVARKLKSKRAPLRPVDIVTEPFKKIAIDIVGELPRGTTGYRYILTIVDYATRYPEAIPLRSTSSKAIADALIHYFSRVSIPDEIVSDQGSNFMSKLMAQLYEQLGITKIKTSVYHPEGNGLVERYNGTMKFVRERVQTWDKYLKSEIQALKSELSEVTKSLNAVWDEVQTLKQKNKDIQDQCDAVTRENSKLNEEVSTLKNRLIKLEDYSRRENLRFLQYSGKSWREQCGVFAQSDGCTV